MAPAQLVQEICHAGRERDFAAGEVIIRQGERGVHFYVLLTGTVRIFAAAEEGAESVQVDLGAGDSFGETVLLTGAGSSRPPYGR
ncbi:MAG: cyclic nucleotide-binding domain-containing protein [bacterium]